ncbi:hypothetical protein ILYODFUR_033176 [Ilyodon furcidens]|uniref:Uncharacterized protein n=2 Tax=Goodeidae TaxID=28758 RepID=A0ABV0TNW2_9TELE
MDDFVAVRTKYSLHSRPNACRDLSPVVGQNRTLGTLESRFFLLLESTSHPSISILSVVILFTDLSAACLCLLSHCGLQKQKKSIYESATAWAGNCYNVF